MRSTICQNTTGVITPTSSRTEARVGSDAYMRARGFREMTAEESKKADKFFAPEPSFLHSMVSLFLRFVKGRA